MSQIEIPDRLRRPRLNRPAASEYLSLVHGLEYAPSTLAKFATVGGGPGFQKAGRTPLYPLTELDDWAAAKLGAVVRRTTSDRVTTDKEGARA